MPSNKGDILSKGEIINDTYEVQFFIGAGAFGEVYRVKHKYLGVQVMKVLKEAYVSNTDIDTVTDEAKILSKLTHPNIVRVFDANSFTRGEKKYYFITMGFVSGETLTQLLARKIQLPVPVALSIQRDLLTGLKFVEEQTPPIVHRDISADNILLSYDKDKPTAMLSDFGLAQSIDQLSKIPNAAGKYIYMAPECFFGIYLPVSDVFSAGIVLYKMITGMFPWEYDFYGVDDDPEEIATAVIKVRRKEIVKPSFYNDNCSAYLDKVIFKAIADNIEDRFNSAGDFLAALNNMEKEEAIPVIPTETIEVAPVAVPPDNPPAGNKEKYKENGFGAVAGMSELKETLFKNIIVPLREKELYDQYKVWVPNGILLYGPPECGKRFIAQKLAEEIECNFLELNFDELTADDREPAKKNSGFFNHAKEIAPVVVFIDEVDTILPLKPADRSLKYTPQGAELLTQMTNCHQYGIFIIAASSRPEKVDNAIFGQDKMDMAVYVPPPDVQARKELFRFYMDRRRSDKNIDFDKMAALTERCTANDIEYFVTEASRIAAQRGTKIISQEHLEEVIANNPPSISEKQLNKYESYRVQKPRHNRGTEHDDLQQVVGKQNSIFISYSHKDLVYLEELKRHFSPLKQSLNLWVDFEGIKTGDPWRQKIEKALDEAEVAILLLSPDFFNSEFISEYEVPHIIRRQKEGLKIIAIVLSPCDTDDFNEYQFLNSIDDPIIDMKLTSRERIWLKAFKCVKEILNGQ